MPLLLRLSGNLLSAAAQTLVTAVFVLGFFAGVILLVELFPEVMFVIISLLCSPLTLIAFFLARS